MDAAATAKAVTALKDAGNASYKGGDYVAAAAKYTEALGIAPSATLLLNRAAAYTQLSRWEEAAEDCAEARKLDPSNAKAYVRGAGAALKLGRIDDAASLLTVRGTSRGVKRAGVVMCGTLPACVRASSRGCRFACPSDLPSHPLLLPLSQSATLKDPRDEDARAQRGVALLAQARGRRRS